MQTYIFVRVRLRVSNTCITFKDLGSVAGPDLCYFRILEPINTTQYFILEFLYILKSLTSKIFYFILLLNLTLICANPDQFLVPLPNVKEKCDIIYIIIPIYIIGILQGVPH